MKPVKTKEKQLLVMAILFLVLRATSNITDVLGGLVDLEWIILSVFSMITCFVIYASYKSHTKNIMKPIIGVALTFLLAQNLANVTAYMQYWSSYSEYYGDSIGIMCYLYLGFAVCLVVLLIAVMYFVINASHESSPKKVSFNNILYIIYAVLLVLSTVFGAIGLGDGLLSTALVTGTISDAFMMGMVVIIENNMEEFRIRREKK